MYMNITNKPIADLVLIGKMLFKEVNLYKPEAFAFYKNTGNYVIFKNEEETSLNAQSRSFIKIGSCHE